MKREYVTDDEIVTAFAGTSFGTRDHRNLVEQGVLKKQAGYSSGYTLECILHELGLVSKKGRVTVRGRKFLHYSFSSRITG